MEAKDETEKIIKKLKKCLPLKILKLDINNAKDMDEESLKKYVSCYDLNPEVNYYVFEKIPSYKEFLDKYKYTLSYNNAKKLGCFNNLDEYNLINSINNKIKDLNINVNDIIGENVQSLSKLKIIEFFLFLFAISLDNEKFKEILNNIENYKLKKILIFKGSINLADNELKYYYFYELFVELFLYNEHNKKNESKKFLSTELEYFPTINNEYICFAM